MSKAKTNESGLPLGRKLTQDEIDAYLNKERQARNAARRAEQEKPAPKAAK